MFSQEVQHENGPSKRYSGMVGGMSEEEEEEEESDDTLPPVRTSGSIAKVRTLTCQCDGTPWP